MFFREFNFGTRMEHMRLSGRRLLSSLVTHKGRIAAVFWFVGYTAALHPDRLTRGRTEAIQWDSPPWCVMHRSIFFFPQKKWVRASTRKKAFGSRLRQAKRSACPTRGWVKFAPPAVRVLEAPMLSVLWGDAEANRTIEGCLSPPQRLKIKQAVGTRCPRTMGGVKCFSNLLLAEGRVDFVVVLQGDLLLLFPDSQSLPGPTAGFGGTTGI